VKVDILAHETPFIQPFIFEDNIRMASLIDIGAMKLNVIVKSGAWKKDFVDLYFLLEQRPLQEYMAAYIAKYPGADESKAHAALVYHDKVMPLPVDFLHREVHLDEIMTRSKAAILNPNKVFTSEGSSKKQDQKKAAKKVITPTPRRRGKSR